MHRLDFVFCILVILMRKHQWTWLVRMLALITISSGWCNTSAVIAHPNRTSVEVLEVNAEVDASNDASTANAPQEVATTTALTVPPAKVKTINKPAQVDSELDLDAPKQEITITLAPEAWTTVRNVTGNVEAAELEPVVSMTASEAASSTTTSTSNATTATPITALDVDIPLDPATSQEVQAVAARVFSTATNVVHKPREATQTTSQANTAITISNTATKTAVNAGGVARVSSAATSTQSAYSSTTSTVAKIEALDVIPPSELNAANAQDEEVDVKVLLEDALPPRPVYPEVETLPLNTLPATPLIPVKLNPVSNNKYIQHVNLEDLVYNSFTDSKFDPVQHLRFSAELYPLTSNIIALDQQLETLKGVAKGKALLAGAQNLVKAFMALQYERTEDDDILNARYQVRFQGKTFEMVNRSAHPDYTYINEFILFAREFNQECQTTGNFSVNWQQISNRLAKANYAREKPEALAAKGSFYPDILAQSCKFFTTYGSVLPQLLQSYNYSQLYFVQDVGNLLVASISRQTVVYPVPLEVIARIAEVAISVPDEPFFYSWSPKQQNQFLAQYKIANDRILELQYQYNNKAYAHWFATQLTLSRNDGEYDEGLMTLRGDYLPILNLYSAQRLCEEMDNWNVSPGAVENASSEVIAYGATHNKVFNQFCSIPYNKVENLRLELQRRYEVFAPELDNQQ